MKSKRKHKHLAKTFLFWCALGLPLLVGGWLGWKIYSQTDLGSACWTSICVENFFGHFKIPLTIMGLSLPFVAMVAAIHRSIEAATQIEVALKQYGEAIANNRFGNYLKHREGFEKLVDGYCSRRYHKNGCKTYVVTSSFYAAMFPDASFDNVDWNGQCDDERFEAIESLAEVLAREVGKSDDEFDVAIFMGALGGLLGHFTINYSPAIGVVVDKIQGEGGAKFSVPALETDAQAIYHAVRDVAGILVLLRSYLGVKGKRGPAVVDKYLRIKKLVEISKGKYSIIR